MNHVCITETTRRRKTQDAARGAPGGDLGALGKGTHAAVRKWLQQEMDIATSLGALSEFYSWYGLRRDLQEADSEVTSLMQLIKEGEYSSIRSSSNPWATRCSFSRLGAAGIGNNTRRPWSCS
ncbi:hypothetical protein [Verrucomicrobium spinosum]|uniref:hypothetical protein n=1 Tax=Verrucomicrobium spinosum TaxID=2736 RepID=UPI0009467023|nr:hypothetical protein [Verrucomicrobium spinosum]